MFIGVLDKKKELIKNTLYLYTRCIRNKECIYLVFYDFYNDAIYIIIFLTILY